MRNIEEAPKYEEEYPKVFSEEEFRELPPRRKWDHTIELKEGHQPPWGKCYLLAAKEKDALKKFITENRQDRRIWESSLPYASPFFFRPKQGTTELRGIQDYCRLNEITVKDRYPLPLIKDVINSVQGSKVYSKMDLCWGFNNIWIKEGDEAKAAFITPMGLYKPLVMQFGLCNAPSTFQRMVDEVLAKEKAGGHVIVYIDDILIHMEDLEQNRYWTRRVLSKLEENKLFCQVQKCQFEATEVEFLGVTLGQGTVKISKKKTEAITNEKPPTTRKGSRQFLGITNYHRKFIQGYSTIARPLHELTKDVPFDWDRKCQEAFEKLVEALTTAPVLALLADEGLFWLKTDTSDLATGAVLSQK
jgi:hypothetical protein